MTTTRIEYLVQQALAGKATPEEWEEFQQIVMQQRQTEELEHALEKSWPGFQASENIPDQQLNEVFASLMQKREEPPPARVIHWNRWIGAAASVLLIISVTVYYFKSSKPATQITHRASDIKPGQDGAILTLGDGSTIVLDSMGNGIVSKQNGTDVVLQNRELVYQSPVSIDPNLPITYNTLTTPRGRQFSVVLPDGTKVWLNAASSLNFPAAFTGAERLVKITGEAYFEVAKDQRTPFVVKANDVDVRVLGTTFNINAYADETATNTTLLEGRVQVTRGADSRSMHPGQQMIAGANGLSLNNSVNTDQVIAWKNGLFNFEGVGIQELMRQVARWYNIEVVYPKGIPSIEFVGKMSRNVSLPDLLEGLKGAGVNFSIEKDRKLIVLP
ncbi:DUF4974 domain-containing protein [Pseudoflavitalea sp. G-6-1-2]|uniref:FecR family protein n=1 Tax=Pseudoflavitalea sp. G-6-1-2 TaxID=2728841 RepID=UPI00146A31CD|nr:FecR family protein [Pseudoflavitalea sp. G-6-1-2]NML19260.1 DUF4974 domain-containing protein [Pseudoflavitalea sp. G-6-1-2]